MKLKSYANQNILNIMNTKMIINKRIEIPARHRCLFCKPFGCVFDASQHYLGNLGGKSNELKL